MNYPQVPQYEPVHNLEFHPRQREGVAESAPDPTSTRVEDKCLRSAIDLLKRGPKIVMVLGLILGLVVCIIYLTSLFHDHALTNHTTVRHASYGRFVTMGNTDDIDSEKASAYIRADVGGVYAANVTITLLPFLYTRVAFEPVVYVVCTTLEVVTGAINGALRVYNVAVTVLQVGIMTGFISLPVVLSLLRSFIPFADIGPYLGSCCRRRRRRQHDTMNLRRGIDEDIPVRTSYRTGRVPRQPAPGACDGSVPFTAPPAQSPPEPSAPSVSDTLGMLQHAATALGTAVSRVTGVTDRAHAQVGTSETNDDGEDAMASLDLERAKARKRFEVYDRMRGASQSHA